VNTNTGEIADMTEVQKRIKAGETRRKVWRELTPEEHETLRKLSPAERIAWTVRRKVALQREAAGA